MDFTEAFDRVPHERLLIQIRVLWDLDDLPVMGLAHGDLDAFNV